MAGRRKRILSEGELALWKLATSDVSPAGRSCQDAGDSRDIREETPADEVEAARDGRARPNGSRRARTPTAPRPSPPNVFDRKLYKRLSTGRAVVHARLDLHGHTAEAAHTHLVSFVRGAHASGKRTLLVITGKGRGSGTDEFNRPRDGVLRRKVPEWLSAPDLSHIVLAFVSAHDRHGGSGAYYVSLRRRR